MSMPKGHRSQHGYATVTAEGGLGYREIAERMSQSGDKMNHSTARNIFLSSMRKIAKDICKLHKITADTEKINKIATDPRFQEGIIEIMKDRDV
jgi:hypothetical protein